MTYADPEGCPPELLQLRRKWRNSGLMQGQIAQQLNCSKAAVALALTKLNNGGTRKKMEALFDSIQANGNGSRAKVPIIVSDGQSEPPALPTIHVESAAAETVIEPSDTIERIVDTLKALAEAAANLCEMRKLCREAELQYNLIFRKAAAAGIRLPT